VAPQIREEPHQDQGILRTGMPLPRPEAGGHQGVGGPCENAQRQIVVPLGVMVREGQCLLTMRGVLRVIEVEDHGSGGLGIAWNEVVNKRLREAVEIGAGHAVFEPGEGRGTR
jgi:hypothetical protein